MDPARIVSALLQVLWPRICAHCREDLPSDHADPLCGACRRKLEPLEPPFCLRCADKTAAGLEFCPRCAGLPRECAVVRSLFLYRGPAASVVLAFKYHGGRRAAVTAGRWMGLALRRYPELAPFDALVAVPLHPSRLRQRGYNQAELLCEGLRQCAPSAVLPLLQRRRRTRSQVGLDRDARRRNIEGAFALRPGADCRGLRLLLVDDVCTSAASLEACARVLREAGAARVCGYVLARQAEERDWAVPAAVPP